MSIDVTMPALSPTMETGTLARWLVGVGDRIKAGDLIAEIETDKATMEFEAADEGTIAELLVAEGSEDIPVGTVIARISEEGEAGITERDEAAASAPSIHLARVDRRTDPVPIRPAAKLEAPVVGADLRASPLARRIAAAKGIDLDSIKGSGARGRIIKRDVVPAKPPVEVAAAPEAPAERTPPPAGVPFEAVRLGGMRKTIARRLTAAKQTVPHFYLSVHCNLDPLLRLRTMLNADLASLGVKLSVNDLLIKALAGALVEVPAANVQFGGDTLYRFGRVDVAMAVAVPDGLVTPVIEDVGNKSVRRISEEARALARAARDGALPPEAYRGGTVSMSNLGMFGISEILPVINPPQAMILGIAAGEQRPWVVDGAVMPATMMTATASFDHRAIDGATGAEMLAAFRRLVEEPMRIIA